MRIGIDLGGSHIACGVVKEDGQIIQKEEIDLQEKENLSEKIVEFIEELIENILKKQQLTISNIDSIGIATPGTASNGYIIHAVNLGIEKFHIAEILQQKYPAKVYVKNDAKCAAIAEYHYGCMKEYSDCVFLTLGTGIGGAAFINNKLIEPKKNPGFEFGHMIIEKNGKICHCGKRGCFETYASMKVLKENLREILKLGNQVDGIKLLEIVKAKKGEENVQEIIKEYIENLSIGISNLINIFEPEVVAIGGSFTYYQDILLKPLQERLEKKDLLFNRKYTPEIKLAKLKNDAGILGASMLRK